MAEEIPVFRSAAASDRRKLAGWERGHLPKIACLAAFLFCLAPLLHGQERGGVAFTLPEGEGKQLVAEACSKCHGLDSIRNLRNGEQGWRDVMEWMVLNGAVLSPTEAETVVRYLVTHFGPGKNPIKTGPLPPNIALGDGVKEVTLPTGHGKDVVEARCTLCHDLGWIVHTRRTRSDWEAVTKNMLERSSLPATPEQIQEIVAYLVTHFGKGDR